MFICLSVDREQSVGITPSSALFTPPEDLIFEAETASDRSQYSEHRPVDVAGLTDQTALDLSTKYK